MASNSGVISFRLFFADREEIYQLAGVGVRTRVRTIFLVFISSVIEKDYL